MEVHETLRDYFRIQILANGLIKYANESSIDGLVLKT